MFYNKELLHCSEGESIDAVFLFTDAALHGPIQAVIMVRELPFDILSIIKKKSVLWGIISRMGFETFLHWHVQHIQTPHCCKIAETQITKINYENILGLWKIFKLTIGMKKINPKENRHKTPRIMWFDNSLHPRATTNKFHYYKFGIKQIGVKALSQTQIPNTPK